MVENTRKPSKGFRIRRFIAFSLLGILLLCSVILLYLKIAEGVQTSKENQGYVRYLACVTEIRNRMNVIAISSEISNTCWAQAEKEVGIPLSRYSEKAL